MGKIVFIGGGNMATAIVGGLVKCGWKPEDIGVVDPNVEKRVKLHQEFGISVFNNANAACNDADAIVLAVKPQLIKKVSEEIDINLEGKLLLSIAAGVTVETLENLFGNIAIARAMPNTPAMIGLGATGLYLNKLAGQRNFVIAKAIVESFGICVIVEGESLLDAVTAVSGSGPAYYFLLIEEMIKTGMNLGLSEEDAKSLTLQTALGAVTMASQSQDAPHELRDRVTSPNGTTQAAISTMLDEGFGNCISAAMTACKARSVELGRD